MRTAPPADPRKWVQVADGIRQRIEAGELQPFDRVPVAEQAQAWQVGRDTAARAVRALASEGQLRRYPGHGYVVIGNPRRS